MHQALRSTRSSSQLFGHREQATQHDYPFFVRMRSRRDDCCRSWRDASLFEISFEISRPAYVRAARRHIWLSLWFPGLRGALGTAGGGGTSEQVERCPTKGSPNMRASMAYFAGAGTVIAAIAGGVGGGLLIADMVSPKSPKQGVEQTRLERRMSPEPIAAANAPAEPVQYLDASQLPPSGAAVQAVPAQAQTQADNSVSQPPQPVDTAAVQPAAPAAQPVAHEQTAAADDAVARTPDADSRRAVEKRRAERHQQWADRRRHQPRQERDLQAVEEKVREETEPRQEFAPEPETVTRVIHLFGRNENTWLKYLAKILG